MNTGQIAAPIWFYFFSGGGGVNTSIPVITTITLPSGEVGTPYSVTLTVSGGTPFSSYSKSNWIFPSNALGEITALNYIGAIGGYVFALVSGSLPSGLSLNVNTGVISGTPTTVAVYSFVISVTDSFGASSTRAFSLTIGGLSISATPGNGVVGQNYTFTPTVSGGSGGPYTWTIPSGTLPLGLSLNGTTGVISGTPTTAGSVTFTLQVTDGAGRTGTSIVVIVITTVRVNGVIEAELTGKGSGWTILTDVRMQTGIVSHRGLSGTRITDRVADISTLRFSLNNDEGCSGGLGYYSPDHVNRRFGWDINIGIRYRIGSDVRFTGTLDDISPIPGTNGPRIVNCTAVGWFDIAQRTKLKNLPILENQRGDAIFQVLMDSLTPISRPRALEIYQSPDTLPYTLDRIRDEQTLLRDEIVRVTLSDLSLAWERGDGTIVWESRTRRMISSYVDTFTDSHGFLASRNRSGIINNAQATIHPRIPGATDVILWSLKTSTAIAPGQTITINGPWTDPANPDRRVGAADLIPVRPIVDYTANTTNTGSGLDITALLSIVVTYSGNSADYAITLNEGAGSGFITGLTQWGRPLYNYGPTVLREQDDVSIEQFGLSRPENLDMQYQADANLAREAIQYIIYTNSTPHTQISAPFTRFIELNDTAEVARSLNPDISSKIRIEDPVTGISRSFFVNAIDEIELETTLKTQWTLAYADASLFWLLEVVNQGELDIHARLGFGLILGHTDIVHQDVHSDSPHIDIAHIDAHTDNIHIDVSHADGVAHGDTAHTDIAELNTPHNDVHGDSNHNDSPHGDVRYTNSHTDIPHSDVAHQDSSHVDTEHGDANYHGDYSTEDGFFHNDYTVHIDDAHVDTPHGDVHNDTVHGDQHNDTTFIDEAHEDIHTDTVHTDVGHGDRVHSDIVHEDNVAHTDAPGVSRPHGDIAHSDVTHADSAHADTHSDRAHEDVN